MKYILPLITFFYVIGCAHAPNKLTPREQVAVDFMDYDDISVKIVTKCEECKVLVEPLTSAISQQITTHLNKPLAAADHRLPASDTPINTLKIEVFISQFKPGNFLLRLLNLGGEAKISGKGRIVEAATQKTLSVFDFEGSSMYLKNSLIVGGATVFSSSWGSTKDELKWRAINSVAVDIAKFIGQDD